MFFKMGFSGPIPISIPINFSLPSPLLKKVRINSPLQFGVQSPCSLILLGKKFLTPRLPLFGGEVQDSYIRHIPSA